MKRVRIRRWQLVVQAFGISLWLVGWVLVASGEAILTTAERSKPLR